MNEGNTNKDNCQKFLHIQESTQALQSGGNLSTKSLEVVMITSKCNIDVSVLGPTRGLALGIPLQ